MEVINLYFSSLTFTKVKIMHEYTLYAARIKSRLLGSDRYIILTVLNFQGSPENITISEVPWCNVQSRCLSGAYKHLRPQVWGIPRGLPDPIFEVVQRTKMESIYMSHDAPELQMTYLHNPKKKSEYQSHNKLKLSAAIDTFSISIDLITSYSPQQISGGVLFPSP